MIYAYILLFVGFVGWFLRVNYLYQRAKKQRLHQALQEWVDAIVELYESDDHDTTA